MTRTCADRDTGTVAHLALGAAPDRDGRIAGVYFYLRTFSGFRYVFSTAIEPVEF
jgi:hypothetical protein